MTDTSEEAAKRLAMALGAEPGLSHWKVWPDGEVEIDGRINLRRVAESMALTSEIGRAFRWLGEDRPRARHEEERMMDTSTEAVEALVQRLDRWGAYDYPAPDGWGDITAMLRALLAERDALLAAPTPEMIEAGVGALGLNIIGSINGYEPEVVVAVFNAMRTT